MFFCSNVKYQFTYVRSYVRTFVNVKKVPSKQNTSTVPVLYRPVPNLNRGKKIFFLGIIQNFEFFNSIYRTVWYLSWYLTNIFHTPLGKECQGTSIREIGAELE